MGDSRERKTPRAPHEECTRLKKATAAIELFGYSKDLDRKRASTLASDSAMVANLPERSASCVRASWLATNFGDFGRPLCSASTQLNALGSDNPP